MIYFSITTLLKVLNGDLVLKIFSKEVKNLNNTRYNVTAINFPHEPYGILFL